VKAVVVVVDSFGGYSNYVEQLYLSLKHLNERKPVVAVAVNALSGGYYICAAASYIFAHPSSFVGAVGVISTAPPLLVPSEVVVETGPYKHTGFSRLLFFSNLSHALDSFLSAIEEGRGSRLKASREELSRGLIYLGTEAVKLGLVDEIGTFDQALEKAVERAGLSIYKVVELGEEGGPQKSILLVEQRDGEHARKPTPASSHILRLRIGRGIGERAAPGSKRGHPPAEAKWCRSLPREHGLLVELGRSPRGAGSAQRHSRLLRLVERSGGRRWTTRLASWSQPPRGRTARLKRSESRSS